MCHGLDHILNTHSVLIESDWNLNVNRFLFNQVTHEVLIESDWNLNLYGGHTVSHDSNRINRIRLEFKCHSECGIFRRWPVLIESDWNLKYDAISA